MRKDFKTLWKDIKGNLNKWNKVLCYWFDRVKIIRSVLLILYVYFLYEF